MPLNSKQINFFLTAADQAALLDAFGVAVEFVVVHSRSYDGAVRLLDNATIKEMGVEILKVYLAQPSQIGRIQLDHIESQPYDVVGVLRSPVIEFSRCYHTENVLRRGRLYFVTRYYAAGVLEQKDDEFLRWADRIIAIARRKLKREEGSFYCGDNALALEAAGTRFDRL